MMLMTQMEVNRSDLKKEIRTSPDCTNVEGGKVDAAFFLEKGATLNNLVLGAKTIKLVSWEWDGCIKSSNK